MPVSVTVYSAGQEGYGHFAINIALDRSTWLSPDVSAAFSGIESRGADR